MRMLAMIQGEMIFQAFLVAVSLALGVSGTECPKGYHAASEKQFCVVDVIEYKNFQSLGCYKDKSTRALPSLEGKDAILDGKFSSRVDAISKCYKAALAKKYKYFALQNGGDCGGAAESVGKYYYKYGRSTACPTDGKGGPLANNVYYIDNSTDYKYGGCWLDSSPRALYYRENLGYPSLDNVYYSRKDAIRKCYEAAVSRGYRYFVLQRGGQCYFGYTGGKTYQENYIKYGAYYGCNYGKGAYYRMDAYRVVPQDYHNIGCWKDNNNKNAVPTLEGENDPSLDGKYFNRQNAIRKCYQAAVAKGFKFFAIKNGGSCSGSKRAGETYFTYGRSYTCNGDGRGGSLDNRVYRIEYSKDYYDLGCWADKTDRAVPSLEGKNNPHLDGQYSKRGDALKKCYQAAVAKGFKYFAVQNGGLCATSATAGDTYFKYGRSDKCLKDGEGGTMANQVYRIDQFKDYDDIGCWKDVASDQAIAPLEGKFAFSIDNNYKKRKDAITKCYEATLAKGFKFFALQDGGRCASSGTAGDTYFKHGRSDKCDKNGKGGPLANHVYRIDSSPDYHQIGCWKDSTTRAMPSLEGIDKINLDGSSYTKRTHAISKCYQAAVSRGFKYFGLQNNGQCYSGVEGAERYFYYGRSSGLCPEKMKGASYINNVYRIDASKDYHDMSCWKDTTNGTIPSLEGKNIASLDGDYAKRKHAVYKCYQAAVAKGFKYFAVGRGGLCSSSESAGVTYFKHGRADNCNWDGEGGLLANNVYKVKDPAGDYYSVGCWRDTTDRAIPTLEGKDYTDLDGNYLQRQNAIEKCHKAAASQGFKYFALQKGGSCSSSGKAGDTYFKYGPTNGCESDGKGGPWDNNVYRIGDDVTAEYKDFGCWDGKSSYPALPSLEITALKPILDTTYSYRKDPITKCYEAAAARGYKFFGVQLSGWCSAGLRGEQTYFKYGRKHSCNINGEGGSSYVNQVYRIVTTKAYHDIGCWKDEKDRAIPTLEDKNDASLGGKFYDRPNAVKRCYQAAVAKGFTFFAVQNRGWCSSSAKAGETFFKYGRSDKCLDDGKGGTWANQVYRVDFTKDYHNLGCWKDINVTAIPSSEGNNRHLNGQYQARKHAIRKCYQAAVTNGFQFFALQNGGLCATSETAGDTYFQYGRSENCAKDGEGGPSASQVYRVDNSKDYHGIGCWNDKSDDRAIAPLEGKNYASLDGTYFKRSDPINKCYEAAVAKGYKYFAIQNGGLCSSSLTAGVTYFKHGQSDKCNKNGTGGVLANNVYRVDSSKDYHKMGCWKDTSTLSIPSLEGIGDFNLDGKYGQYRTEAISKCFQAAINRGFRYFALQKGGYCYSGVAAGETYFKYGRYDYCSENGKGGTNANQLYRIDSFKDYHNVGCWKDTEKLTIPSIEGKDNNLDGKYSKRQNAISKCYAAAVAKGFKYFALQNGGMCVTSATAGDQYFKHGRSDKCSWDGKGGLLANNVYRVTAPAKDYYSVGCWKDSSKRAIATLEGKDFPYLDGKYLERKDAISKCYKAAISRGYQYFALQEGSCASNGKAGDTYYIYGTSHQCIDGKGGVWANNVYRVGDNVTAEYKDFGCWYGASSNPALPSLEKTAFKPILDTSYSSRKDPITKCYEAAAARGYTFFGVQLSGWCSAGLKGEQTYFKYGRKHTCARNGEGGSWSNQVYRIVTAKAYHTIGCWWDKVGEPAIGSLENTNDPSLDGKYFNRENAIHKCYEAATAKGFKFFALQNGGLCSADATAGETYLRYYRSSDCLNDGKGGVRANEVYRVDFTRDYHNLGCWTDTSDRTIPTMEGKNHHLDGEARKRTNAIQKCYQTAITNGFNFFALQNGGSCATSEAAGNTYFKHGRSDKCAKDGNGGPWANQVYRVDNTKDFHDIGCWTDKSHRAIPPLEGRNDVTIDGAYSTRNDAITKCYEAATARGFKYFALQDGGWCASSATAGQTYFKYGRSDKCHVNGKGGKRANQVYRVDASKDYHKLGCWKESSTRSIWSLEGIKDFNLDGTYSSRKNKISKCYEAAINRGFKFFALVSNGECHSDVGAAENYYKYGREYSKCLEAGAGGSWANQVYRIDASKDYHSVGCWKDQRIASIPTLEGRNFIDLDGKYKERKDAINKCYRAAVSKGFKYFALQNGGSCASHKRAGFTYHRYGRSDKCSWDGEGGLWANHVYRVNVPANDYYSVGCWNDTSHSLAIPSLEGQNYGYLDGNYLTRQDAINKCYVAALSMGYQYFAVQNGGMCLSSGKAVSTYFVYGRSEKCNDNGKGGLLASNVYRIGDHYEDYQDFGCWRDTSTRAITSQEGNNNELKTYYTSRKDAIRKCYEVAVTRAYKYFSVQNGGMCMSSLTAGKTYFKYGGSVGCKRDKEGGSYANQVYRVVTSKKYHRIGCWKDESNRAFPLLEGTNDPFLDHNFRNRTDAIEKCYQAAIVKGFTFFSLQDGGMCGAGYKCDKSYTKYGRSWSCRQDGKGGLWANQVYRVDYTKDYHNIGCWKDTTENAIPELKGSPHLDGKYQSRKDAIKKCYQAAVAKGFKYFALQNGGWCASSETAGKTFFKYGRSDKCLKDGEGGPRANQVYLIDDVKNFRNVGCWNDTSNHAIPTLEGERDHHRILDGYYRNRKDAITKCYEAAVRKGFKFFAVQDGGRCDSSLTAGESYFKYGRSDKCHKNGKGGVMASQVYRVDYSKDYHPMGCWGDYARAGDVYIDSLESLNDVNLVGTAAKRVDAVSKCYQAAITRGYKYFAVTSGACRSSAWADGYLKNWRSVSCPEDGRGGSKVLNVYRIVYSKDYHPVGCWKDPTNRAILTLEGHDNVNLDGVYSKRKDAVSKCYRAAVAKGFKYFAVQLGGWCSSSDKAAQTYHKDGEADKCSCSWDGKGGRLANSVYRVNVATKDYHSIGCFVDTSDRAIATLEGGDDGILVDNFLERKDPVSDCYKAASSRGYQYFAVQNGGLCYSNASAGVKYFQYGSQECDKANNGRGGLWVNDVYRIGASTPGYVSLGCWKDSSSYRAIPSLESKGIAELKVYYTSRKYPIDDCYKAARVKGFKYFSVQYSGQCYSGKDAGKTYFKYGRSYTCKNGEGAYLQADVYMIV